MQHFNARDAKIVPELATLDDCDITFDVQTSRVFDTASTTHLAAKSVVQAITADKQNGQPQHPPCAFVGGWTSLPAVDLSVQALSMEIPFAVHRASNARVADAAASPWTSLVYPDLVAEAGIAVDYLRFLQRTDFVALVYAQSESGVQQREAMSIVLDSHHMKWMSSGYLTHFKGSAEEATEANYVEALQRVQNAGYRTIILMMENAVQELPLLADAAEALQMNQGDHLYFLFDFVDVARLYASANPNVTKLLTGASTVMPTSRAFLEPWADPFALSLAQDLQDAESQEILKALNPIAPGEPGYVDVSEANMTNVLEFGTTFMYEAVMAIGVGACLAQNTNGTVTGKDHLHGVHEVDLSGPSGRLKFREDQNPGRRVENSLTWGVWMLRSSSLNASVNVEGNPAVLVYNYSLEEGTWEKVATPIYRDGRSVPPDLLRDTPDQNYLAKGLRTIGLVMMYIVLATSLAATVWIIVCRERRVVRASQPFFLFLICFGTAIEAFTVWPVSHDEAYTRDDQLDLFCAATPWFFVSGHVLIYGSLATKLWRVQRVLQFSRREIKIKDVMGPLVVLISLSVGVLLVWTIVDPLQWERRIIDEDSGESFGTCRSDSLAIFMTPEVILLIIPAAMTGWMAWKTKDVDDLYTESWYIFVMISLQVEIAIVAGPVIAILEDVSTDGQYLGVTAMLTLFPMSTLLFIFGPKVLADYKERRGGLDRTKSKRGERHGVVVTGAAGASRSGQAHQHSLHSQFSSRKEATSIVEEPVAVGSRRAATSIAEEPAVVSNTSGERPQSEVAVGENDRPTTSDHELVESLANADATTGDEPLEAIH
jgi:hypothetical protein